jgi:hypothetical protein
MALLTRDVSFSRSAIYLNYSIFDSDVQESLAYARGAATVTVRETAERSGRKRFLQYLSEDLWQS